MSQRETDKFIITEYFNTVLSEADTTKKMWVRKILNNAIKLELMAIYGILHPQIWEFYTYAIFIKIDHY